MNDNLEQSERDWPQARPKDMFPRGTVRLCLATTILLSALIEIEIVLVILHLKSHQIHLWHLKAASLEMAALMPWVAAIGFRRRIGADLVVWGGPQNLRLTFEYQGVVLLGVIYVAMQMIVGVLLSVLELMRIAPR